MKNYDLTHWLYARSVDCMETPCIHANDNGHEEWQDWFHVKPWATDSLFDKVDWDVFYTYEEYRKVDNVIYLEVAK